MSVKFRPDTSDTALRFAFSREELTNFSRDWMLTVDGMPRDMEDEQRERWYVNMGLLTHFLNDLWESRG